MSDITVLVFNTAKFESVCIRDSTCWQPHSTNQCRFHSFATIVRLSTILIVRGNSPLAKILYHQFNPMQAACAMHQHIIPHIPWGCHAPTSIGLGTCRGCQALSSNPTPAQQSQLLPTQPLCHLPSLGPICRLPSSHLPSQMPACATSLLKLRRLHHKLVTPDQHAMQNDLNTLGALSIPFHYISLSCTLIQAWQVPYDVSETACSTLTISMTVLPVPVPRLMGMQPRFGLSISF